MTVQILAAMAAGVAGLLLGLGFYWGQWITVDGLPRARRPALRLAASLLVRFGVVLLAFYLLARHGDWPLLLAAALGFVAARPLVVRAVLKREQGSGSRP